MVHCTKKKHTTIIQKRERERKRVCYINGKCNTGAIFVKFFDAFKLLISSQFGEMPELNACNLKFHTRTSLLKHHYCICSIRFIVGIAFHALKTTF